LDHFVVMVLPVGSRYHFPSSTLAIPGQVFLPPTCHRVSRGLGGKLRDRLAVGFQIEQGQPAQLALLAWAANIGSEFEVLVPPRNYRYILLTHKNPNGSLAIRRATQDVSPLIGCCRRNWWRGSLFLRLWLKRHSLAFLIFDKMESGMPSGGEHETCGRASLFPMGQHGSFALCWRRES
jgi:hypothetical protein